ncbi:MAG: hypothetical protein Q4B40_03530, partial [Clostridia bacterium]|nr:hypothetical protein [Clostridia bacterium]
MNFLKQKTDIIFLFIIFMLAAALAAVSFVAYNKHTKYVEVTASLTNNSSELDKVQKKIDEFTSKIAEDEKEKAELNSQLQ